MVTRLRTLTKKSKLGFGKYAEQTVETLTKTNRTYLVWVYYNISGITFTDEILDNDLSIVHRIEKPGKNPELSRLTPTYATTTLKAFKVQKHYEKEKKIRRKNYQKLRENAWFNKAANTWKNQGH